MTKIFFHKIIPHPIKETYSPSSDVWGKELCFETKNNYHICAPSGTGKTTLSHILYGLRHDYDGEFRLNDVLAKTMNSNDWSTLRQSSISIIYQDLKLLEEYSGLENIEIKNRLTNCYIIDEIFAFAEKLGIARLLNKSCKTMSRGERQRVCILRALCQPFQLLILDEAFSHLDAENTQKASALIAHVAQQNYASIIACNLFEDDDFHYHKKLKL